MKYRKVATIQLYSQYGQKLKIVARGEDKKRYEFVKGNLPSYFFVDTEPTYERDKLQMIKSIKEGYKSINGIPLWRIETYKSRDTNTLREGHNHYEADILWTERCCLDLKLTDGFRWENNTTVIDNEVDHIELRTWTLDIEVGAKTFDEAQYKNPQGFTACIVVYDNYDDKYYYWRLDEFKTERDMFHSFVKVIREKDPDIITGWNIDYDVSWIMARMEKLDLDVKTLSNHGRAAIRHWTSPDGKLVTKFDIAGRIIFDGLDAYKKKKNPSGQLSSYSLKSIAVTEGLPTWEDLGAQVYQYWGTRSDEIVEYCKKDVEATRYIIEKERLIELSLLICRFSGCTMEQTTSKDKIVDHALLLRRGDGILPSKKRRDNVETKVKGAIVLLPEAGIHKGVGVFDAAALYPTIIQEFNISPETKSADGTIKIKSPEGQTYSFLSKDVKEGLLPKGIQEFINLREHYRKLKREAAVKYGHESKQCKSLEETETAVKFIATSFYGVNGFKNFRLFDEECANAITAVGRKIIVDMRDKLIEKGFPVQYGDTDSTFISIENVENGYKVGPYIKEIIDESLSSMGVRGDGITVKFEKFFEWIIFKRRNITKKDKEEISEGNVLPADPKATITSLVNSKTISVKKKYIGYCTFSEGTDGKMQKDDYLYIRGFETRRSDANKFLKTTMTAFFESLKTLNIDNALGILRKCKNDFFKLDYRDIAIPRQVLSKEANNPWARGMRFGIDQLGWHYEENSAPELLYLKSAPMARGQSNVILPANERNLSKCICIQEGLDLPRGFEVDYKLMFDKVIKEKFKPILDSLGLNWDVEMEGQRTLEAWT